MGVVVPFPNLPLIGASTPPACAVIVAPHPGGQWIAWVQAARGRPVVLEATSNREQVIDDARTYAARHMIPLRIQDAPLAADEAPPTPGTGGEVWVQSSERDGGSWDVEHISASGDTMAVIANSFSFDGAVAIARDAAARLGATFEDPYPHFGGAA